MADTDMFGAGKTGREFSAVLERVSIANDTIDAIEERIGERQKDRLGSNGDMQNH